MAWPQFDAAEVAFWQRLRDALAAHDLQLVLASTTTPPADLDVVHLPVLPSIDGFVPLASPPPGLSLADIGLSADALLAREADWGAPSLLPAIDAFRRRAMDEITNQLLHMLAAVAPRVVVIWNGQHVVEMILAAASRLGGVPTLYVERAPIPQMLFADEQGLSAASGVARQASWTLSDPQWRERADAVVHWLTEGSHTWWSQPASRGGDAEAWRRQLGVPGHARVVLFAAQVDQDTQQFLFSPHFERNLDAFAWLLDQLRGRDDVFVLGKHHPKSRTDPDAYRRVLARSGVPGAWRTDLAIDDALTAADRVAAVNSTVLYEALARRRPVLAMGDWLLGARGAAWEIRDRANGREPVVAWLDAEDHAERQSRWRDSLSFLLSSSLYSWAPSLDAAGIPGASHLAARIAVIAERTAGWRLPPRLAGRSFAAHSVGPRAWAVPGDGGLEDSRLWQRAHLFRHHLLEGLAASGRGRRLIVWGAGAAGRAAAAALAAAGTPPAGFMSTSPDCRDVDGLPLFSPADLIVTPPRDFVLVASAAASEIIPVLTAKEFAPAQDYHVLDVDILAQLAPPSR